jgi:radical SAM-linked protein
MTRIRLRYSKHGKVRFLSHRDMAKVVERAIRRAKVPVAYSEGFSPRPKLHFGLALSTGYESEAEYLDLDLDPDRVGVREPGAIGEALQPCLPAGVVITATAAMEPGEPSLQDAVTSTAWQVDLATDIAGDPADLAGRADGLLSAATHEIEIVRKGKQVREDLRPLLLALSVEPTGGVEPINERARLTFELGTKPRSVRPAELLAALGVSEPVCMLRTHQWIQRDGRRFEPLGLPDASPHAEARAS